MYNLKGKLTNLSKRGRGVTPTLVKDDNILTTTNFVEMVIPTELVGMVYFDKLCIGQTHKNKEIESGNETLLLILNMCDE